MVPSSRAELIFAGTGAALIACQACLLVATRGLTHDSAASLTAVVPLILGLAVPTGLMLVAAPRLAAVPASRFVMIALVTVGLLMRVIWLATPPPLDDDYYRYLWDGAVVARGLDPYAHAPETFLGTGNGVGKGNGPAVLNQIAEGAQKTLRGINFPDMRTIYPSVAQATFALAHVIAPFEVDGLRLVFLGGELATLWLLITMLGRLGQSPLSSLLYWWNPFVAFTMIGIVHIDALIPPLVLGAVLANSLGRPITALTLIGIGAGVKLWPLVLAPLVLWPLLRSPVRLARSSLWLGAILALAIGPVLLSALRPGSGLSAYAAGWNNNNALYAWVLYAFYVPLGTWEAAERAFRPLLPLATAGLALVMAARGEPTLRSLSQRALVIAAATFYLSPAQFPWYAAWFLPLAALCRNWPLLLASALLPTYYLFFPLWPVGNGTWFFYGTAFLHSLPVLGWLAYEAYRRSSTSCRPHEIPVTAIDDMTDNPPAGTPPVAVIIPVLNEADALPKVLASIPSWVSHVIVADNCSSDGSGDIARAAGAMVVEEPRRGYGSACLKAIASLPANVGIVVFMDGDASDDASEMAVLVAPIAQREADLVLGSRVMGKRDKGALTPQQMFGNALACSLIRLLWGVRFTDLGPFRAIRRDALDRLRMADPDYGWTVEMQVRAAKLGLVCREIPARYRKRIGTSKVSGTIRGVIGAGTKILYVIGREALGCTSAQSPAS